MRRRRSAALVLATAGLLGATLALTPVAATKGVAPAARFVLQPSLAAGGPISITTGHCWIGYDRAVASDWLVMGDRLAVTTSVTTECHDPRPLHLVLLVDATETMGTTALGAVKASFVDALRRLDMAETVTSPVRIGIVALGGRAEQGGSEVKAYLTGDPNRVANTLRGLTTSGVGCLACGLADALIVLRSGRGGRGQEEFREVILLVASGEDPAYCEVVKARAREARGQGVMLVTACSGAQCERRCLAEAASTPRFALRPGDWQEASHVLTLLKDLSGPFYPVQAVQVVDEPAPGFRLAEADPKDVVRGRIDSTTAPWSGGSMEVAYTLEPLACGTGAGATTERAELTLRFADGHGERMTLPDSEVVVHCSLPEPTASPTRGSVPTTTATPTPSPSAPVASETPTPPAGTGRLHLPALANRACAGARGSMDLVIVIDVSGSMAAPLPPYANRWEAARHLALELVLHLDTTDRVAVMAFADRTRVIQAMTTDHAAAADTIQRNLPKEDGSRVDRALERALAEVVVHGAPGRRAVVALITDADLNQTEVADLAAAAERVRRVATLQVVLMGDAEPEFWMQLAGERRNVAHFDPARVAAHAAGAGCR